MIECTNHNKRVTTRYITSGGPYPRDPKSWIKKKYKDIYIMIRNWLTGGEDEVYGI